MTTYRDIRRPLAEAIRIVPLASSILPLLTGTLPALARNDLVEVKRCLLAAQEAAQRQGLWSEEIRERTPALLALFPRTTHAPTPLAQAISAALSATIVALRLSQMSGSTPGATRAKR